MKTTLSDSKSSLIRAIAIIVILLFVRSAWAQYPAGSPVAMNGKLKVSGTHLVSECGNPVQLRGMSSHGLQWFGNCNTSSALDALANSWGADIFRLAMYVQEGGYANDPSGWKTKIDSYVDLCGSKGIYCLIDWHVLTPGDPNADITLARDFWSYMSAKHGSKKHVLYEICNEPNGVSWSTVKTYANDIIPRIRANDPNTVIIVGTPNWSQDVDVAASDPLSFSNVMYTLHFYAGTHAQSFRDKGNTAMSRGAAIFCTEWGTSQASGTGGVYTGESDNWISWMSSNKISWCNWSFSDDTQTSAALNPGSCSGNSWNNTSTSGSYVKGKMSGGDNFTNCGSSTSTGTATVTITSPANNATFTAPATITINANATITSGSITKVDFYNGNTLLGSDATSAYSFVWNNVAGGTYTITAKATDNTGTVTSSSPVTIIVNVPQGPYTVGSPMVIPGMVEAEKYDVGGQGVAYNDADAVNSGGQFRTDGVDIEACSDAGGGYDIGYIAAGEWLEYTVNVTTTGTYNFLARVASTASGKTFHIEMNGTNVTGTMSVPNTGGFQTWQTVTASNIKLTAGNNQLMRIYFDTDGFNLNYVNVTSSNQPPAVSITSPGNNATFTAPASITINATASDADGTVSKVDFYNGSTLLGSSTSSPYSFVWSNVASGTYTLTAKATDNAGAVTTSSAITVVVSATPNTAPTVSITSPANGASFTAPASITINATAADADGTVSNVAFYNGSTLLGTDASSPYSFAWNNVAAGTYSLTARATDNSGAITTSTAVSITVSSAPNVLPTVSITAPATNATYTAPANITMNATAADADGTISSVAFYNGSTLLGSDASSPYSFVWNNVAAGTYSLTARATDNNGGVTTSAIVSITVNPGAPNQPPTVSITNPANGASFTAPASITINATAADADGTVSSVAFYNGSALLGSDATSPYSFVWNNVAAGTYNLTAIATDNSGATTTSAVITITVNPAPPSTTIQCETACTVDGALNETANAGYTGTGYVNTNDVLGASATWAVNSTTAQTVSLGIRYAHNTASGRPMSLSVNGTVQVANIPFPATGSPTTWVTTTVQISLTAGANSIQMVSLAAIGSPYLDAFTFGSTTVSAGTCTTTTNNPPTVSLTSPTNGATFTAPASITINATAADADGTISSVAFYNGSTLLGSDATSPYSFAWTNVAAGTYTLTAKATDNSGAVTTSAAISVTVNGAGNVAPTVSITLPANNATFTAPASITINANAADADGTVSSVAFYNGSTLLGTDATSAYSFTWTNVAAGTYTLTAKATDNSGAVTTSSAITVVVNPATTTTGVTIQAETACTVDGAFNETANAGYTGTGYVNTDDVLGASATWAVNSQTAQAVSLDIRYAHNTATGRPMSLSVNGTVQVANIPFPATGSPSTWVTTTVQISLAAGANTIKMVSLAAIGSPYIDAFTYGSTTVSAGSCTTTPATVTIQAETACSVDGALNETANAGYTGTGYVNTNDVLGASATWALNSQTAQTVNLDIRYAHNTASGRPMSLSVNGTVQVANIPFPATGSPSTWVTTTVQVSLAAGTNTIKMVSLAAIGSPYLDAFTYGSGTVSAGSCASLGLAAAAAAPQSTVGPNPSSGAFTISAVESIESFTVVNSLGLVVYTGSSVAAADSVTFGESLTSGLYVLYISYANGTTESRKLQKTL
jgi:aryl-phospho-beta-D-glucosidase BglC (GH1 family)